MSDPIITPTNNVDRSLDRFSGYTLKYRCGIPEPTAKQKKEYKKELEKKGIKTGHDLRKKDIRLPFWILPYGIGKGAWIEVTGTVHNDPADLAPCPVKPESEKPKAKKLPEPPKPEPRPEPKPEPEEKPEKEPEKEKKPTPRPAPRPVPRCPQGEVREGGKCVPKPGGRIIP
jgi:hypothetical protein